MATIHSAKDILKSENIEEEGNEISIDSLDSITHTPAVLIRKL